MTAIFTSVLFLHSSNFAVIKSVIYSVISKSLHLLTGISNLLQSVIRQLWFISGTSTSWDASTSTYQNVL